MDGVKPEVHEEWAPFAGSNEIASLVGHAFIHMAARFVLNVGITDELVPGREVATAGAGCFRRVGPVHVETLVTRLVGVARCHVVPEVPLAKMARRVTRLFQDFSQSVVVGLQTRERVGDIDARVRGDELLFQNHRRQMAGWGSNASARGMLTDHNARTCRRTEWTGRVGIFQPHALRCEAIDVRRLIVIAAETSQVVSTEVIGKD